MQQDQLHSPQAPPAGDNVTATASKNEDSSDDADAMEVSEQASASEIPVGGREEELQGLLQEEKLLLLEHQELLSLQADLQGRVQEERTEIERLRAELESARTKYSYR